MTTILRKYPSTKHVPWTQHSTTDDKIMSPSELAIAFEGKEVVSTLKMDGENTTMYSDHIHARSTSGRDHPSRHWIKALWSQVKSQIPTNWRICGENLRQQHSIHYSGLGTYFFVFAIFDENDVCLSYDDTKEFVNALGLRMVPEIYRGQWSRELVHNAFERFSMFETYDVADFEQTGKRVSTQEGYVIRVTDAFPSPEPRKGEKTWFKTVAKFVRHSHVQTDEHWMHQQPIWNDL